MRGGGGSFGSFGRLLKVTGDDRDVKGVVVVVVVAVVVVDDVSVVAHDVSVLEDVAAALDDGDGGHGVRRIRIALRSPSLLRGQIIPTARRAGTPKDVFLTLLAHGKKVDQRQTKVASKGNTFFWMGRTLFCNLLNLQALYI